ncbi:Not1-domain-containing protein [Polychaeton citri CBS 116435]|uniref:General negative regulator of transcription subunit 1 n=1 Tax=Polychaeton citri CBS 116435 TaxID=1314669 RepID=A0A9P4QGM3_9PEZI|nr:Not1-domain-containing protein [Polychaeton citri CBS 116435]
MSGHPRSPSQEQFQQAPRSSTRALQNPQAITTTTTATAAGQSAAASRQPSRRGLTPISTVNSAQARVANPLDSPARTALSPTGFAFNQPASAAVNRQGTSRHSSTSSNQSIVSPSANYATSSFHSSQRSRTFTTSGSPRLASSAANPISQSGRESGSRLARHSPSLPVSTVGSPVSAGTGGVGGTGQLTSLVITQLNILLSTIKDLKADKDRPKWEVQAEKIWRLVESNGMEVHLQYLRRLLQGNVSTVFGGARPSTDGNGSYHLLVAEMQKISQDSQQAEKIAQALDSNEGDMFRDFDLATFVDHFGLDPIAKLAVILPLRTASKPDLRTKADAILASNFSNFLSSLASPQEDVPAAVIASTLDRLLQDPPKNWSEEQRTDLAYAIRVRYNRLQSRIPPAIAAAMSLTTLLESSDSRLAKLVQRTGPRGTSSVDSCKEMLTGVETRDMSYSQVANALLFMVIAQNGDAHDPSVFVEALRQHRAGSKVDWTDVVQNFDRPDLTVSKKQFLLLFNALLPIAKEQQNFDIQSLWGGPWHNPETQLNFVTAFLACDQTELDVGQIPNFRPAFTLEEFADASDAIKATAREAVKHPFVSRDATEALFTMIFRSQETYTLAQMLNIPEVLINPNMTIFVCAASAVPKPWAALQEQALKQLFYPFLLKQHENFDFVMHALWKHDKTWVAARMVEFYQVDHTLIALVFEHAQQHGWLDLLLTISSNFAVDLAAYAHGKGQCDLQEWAQPHIANMGMVQFATAMIDFLKQKMDDESLVQKEGSPPSMVPLSIGTLHSLIGMVSEALPDEDFSPFQRQVVALYPRLINYGEDERRDAIIEANGQRGNGLPEEAVGRMEEEYKKMYGGGIDANDLIPDLKRMKTSDHPNDQELFASMVHGLFDEYNCFGEYPNEALATTAVLFGGIIASNVLSGISWNVALYMVFEAVSEYGPDDPMWRFGLQALVQLQNFKRLKEWPFLCERILQTKSLRGTEVEKSAAEILKELQQDNNGVNGDTPNGITNGALEDEFPVDASTPPFSSVRVDPPLRPEIYETPDEEVSDKVMFVLNNVSKRNLPDKFKDLKGALEDRHHQWFAHYLVEELAKSQPNFQGLYLQLLENFDQRLLWGEVLRETYVACSRMLNAQSTMDSIAERTNLKNLAGWLGSLTLARDQPILQRNISFRDLLLEAHDTQRLIVAIPFTCKVLTQAAQSRIFKPPNPWLMELLGNLAELYHFMELKLNLKFEIEVLCKELNIDLKNIEPADTIRSRPLLPDNGLALQPYVDNGPEGFGDMHIMGLSKRPPNERFSPKSVIQNLPNLSQRLHIPQAAGNITQAQLSDIFVNAAQAAINEIIAPVVERSVTIAAISTAELVQKDFATEADVDRVRNSAHTVVKALSGSLALVTCKEPLRMSIMNNIRIFAVQNLSEQLPEGQILMFVNDNIDTVCGLVEQAAEEHSLAEIDAQLAQALDLRRQHNEGRPNEPFANPPLNRWAQLLPEPYRQEMGGLNGQQLALYEEFARQARITPAAHGSAVSQDPQRQLPDILSDSYLPNLPTPAGEPAVPREVPPPSRMQQMRPPQAQVNGYMNPSDVGALLLSALADLQHAAQDAPEEHIKEIGEGAPVRRAFERLIPIISESPQRDQLAMAAGQQCLQVIFTEAQKRLEIEVLVRLMTQLCRISVPAGRTLIMQLASYDDDRFFNAAFVSATLREGLLDLQQIDSLTAKACKQRRTIAVDFLKDLLDEILLSENPIALRADFILTFDALSQWLKEDPAYDAAREITNKLQLAGEQTNGMPSPPESEKQDQLEYVFEEWSRLQRKDTPEHAHIAFVQQLHRQHIVAEENDAAAFFRSAIELSSTAFEREMTSPYGSLDAATVQVDALARLIVLLAIHHNPTDRDAHATSIKYFEALLRLNVLVMMDTHNKQREQFNARFWARLFSTLLWELSVVLNTQGIEAHQNMLEIFIKVLEITQPKYLPGFTFAWLSLASNHLLVHSLLKGAAYTTGGWGVYTKVLVMLFNSLGHVFTAVDVTPATYQEFYRGALRFVVALHHDFPDFLVENHIYLNAAVPRSCTQLHNIVNSATPLSRVGAQPDPFTPGLKINRLDNIRDPPTTQIDVTKIMEDAKIASAVEAFVSGEGSADHINTILSSIDEGDSTGNVFLVNALILWIGYKATATSSVFSAASGAAKVIDRLTRDGSAALRYQIVGAMVNQVRYANSHTHWFSTALQHFFNTGNTEMQETIIRALVERLIQPRPHPWAVILLVIEIIKNHGPEIFAQPWLKSAPQVESMLVNLVQQTEASNGRFSV